MPVSASHSPSASLLSLHLFGEPEVRVGDIPLPALRTRKGIALLALLALRASDSPAPLERETVAGLLWPDSPQTQALATLRRTLTDLRAALGPSASDLLTTPTPRSLGLDLSCVDCDVARFDRLTRSFASAPEAALQEAVTHYRGPLLAGFHDEWVLQERARREHTLLATLQALAERAEAKGDTETALRCLRQMTTVDPLHEAPYRALLRLLARIGDFGAAILTYRALRERLHSEANTEPSAETTALFQQIRATARTGGKDPAPLAPIPSPDKESVRAATVCLPTETTAFIGREAERAVIVSSLQRPLAEGGTRLLTLVGLGGIGKTRLALAAAEALAAMGTFPGGTHWVDLAACLEEKQIIQTLLTTLHIPQAAPPITPQEMLREHLAAQAEPQLLVIDNAEQVAAPVAALIADLLQHAPTLHLLVTSRRALHVPGETIYAVPLLEIGDAAQPGDAERLFLARLAAVSPLAPDHDAVGRICARLDGLPLAIELAAARARLLTLPEIEARLQDRFALLGTAPRATVPRQKTLRALLDWSYDLLSEPEQRLFTRLSVFPHSFTTAFAHAICGEPDTPEWDTLDALADLADKSLVVRTADGRFRLLETVREYSAQRRTDSRLPDTIRQRHLAVFAGWADSLRPALLNEGQQNALNLLDGEAANLHAALDYALQTGDPASLLPGMRLCRALLRWWGLRSTQTAGRAYVRQFLELSESTVPEPDPDGLRGDLLTGLGNLARQQSDYAEAQRWHEAALAYWRQAGEPGGIANSLGNLATIAHHRGEWDTALALREEGLQIKRDTGDQRGIAMFLQNTGNLHSHCGRHPEAIACLEESLAIRQARGDKDDIAHSLMNLAAAVFEAGDKAAARTYTEESLRLLRELGDGGGIVTVLDNLATMSHEMSDAPAACSYLRECFQLFRTVNTPRDIAMTLFTAAILLDDTGHSETAVRLLAAAAGLRCRTGSKALPRRAQEEQELLARLQEKLAPAVFTVAWLTGERWSQETTITETIAALERLTSCLSNRGE